MAITKKPGLATKFKVEPTDFNRKTFRNKEILVI